MRRLVLTLVAGLLASAGARGQVPAPVLNLNSSTATGNGTTQTLAAWMNLLGATVPTLAGLKALTAGSLPAVLRTGYTALGDGGAGYYVWSASPCSLNSGAGDNGSQVKPTTGTGCWLADLHAGPVTPLLWGAKGDGFTDDTAALQAAIVATSAAGVPLIVADASHRYVVSSSLTSTGIVDLEGFAPVGNNGVANAQRCVSGLLANTDINLLALSGPKAIVRNVCIEMTPNTGSTRSYGAAILLGGSDMQGSVVSGNTIFRPYDGISFGGGTAPNNHVSFSLSENNVIRDPARYGIVVGLNTAGGITAGITLNNNQIGCDADYNTSGIGFAFFDGAVFWDGTTVGPNNCFRGTIITPGTVSGVGQNVNGEFHGVMGDSSGSHYTGGSTPYELYINPSTAAGAVEWLSFVDTWAASVMPNAGPVYVGNTNGGGCSNIKFTGVTVHSGGAGAEPMMNLVGCSNIVISGSQIDAWPSGTTVAGIHVAVAASHVSITGNHIGAEGGGVLAIGIRIASGAGYLVASGNDLSEPTLPISYTPLNYTDRVVFGLNQGVDDLCPSIASAATISLTNASSCFHLTGTTTVTSILNPYDNRRITLLSDDGVSINTGGGSYPICSGSVTLGVNASASYIWNFHAPACWSRLQ